MTSEGTENRGDDGGNKTDVTSPSELSLSETPEQYGQRVARELLEKSFSSDKADKDIE